jgi:hypothetical protein
MWWQALRFVASQIARAHCPTNYQVLTSLHQERSMFQIWRCKRLTIVANVTLSALMLSAALTSQAIAGGKTITAVMHSDLRVIDPGFTPAYITRDHGYMVYDTLLATDANFKIQPQMADWKISDDKLTYTFTLRDGLKWHDGAPVTAEDCVASLKRWGQNDSMGQKLMDFTTSMEATDAKNHHAEAERALRPGARIDRETVIVRPVHDAQAAGGNAARPADQGTDRIRSLQVCAGRIPTRREGGL